MANAKKVVANKEGPVHIICILDQSPSMSHLTDSVISGFNEFIQEQKLVKGEAILSTIMFNNKVTTLHNRIDIQDTPVLTGNEYSCGGYGTALNDAIGETLLRYSDGRAMVFINTDGQENSSREYNTNQAKELIQGKQTLGWEFMFAGTGIDGFAQGGANYGLSKADSVSFASTFDGTTLNYSSMSTRSTSYRTENADQV